MPEQGIWSFRHYHEGSKQIQIFRQGKGTKEGQILCKGPCDQEGRRRQVRRQVVFYKEGKGEKVT